VGDQIERDVDAARRRRHIVGMLIDGLLIERVELCDLRGSARRTDPFHGRLELVGGSSGEEHLRSLTGERLGDRAADRASASVDHRVLSLEQHPCLLIVVAGSSARRAGRQAADGVVAVADRYRPGSSSPPGPDLPRRPRVPA
jgi:hypothetical protein